jgi:hypothetical protein
VANAFDVGLGVGLEFALDVQNADHPLDALL